MEQVALIGLVIEGVGLACWVVCFWWMHRLSSRQEAMLKELHEVTGRIERLSQREHDLISQVHPTVEKIKESVKDVAVAVSAEDAAGRTHRH
jgi:hypothetical protein